MINSFGYQSAVACPRAGLHCAPWRAGQPGSRPTRTAPNSRPGSPGGRSLLPNAFCRHPSKQRHTAGCPAIEVRILYPFHPRSGETVAVVGARRHAGIAHFIIRQPDLTLALLPAWMTEASRRAQAVVVQPRLSVERLADLRALVDALMASCIGDPPPCNGAGNVERATGAAIPSLRPNPDHRIDDQLRPESNHGLRGRAIRGSAW